MVRGWRCRPESWRDLRLWEFVGRTGEVGLGCGVWRVERGGLRWVGIELRWEGLGLGEAGFEEVGIERWV